MQGLGLDPQHEGGRKGERKEGTKEGRQMYVYMSMWDKVQMLDLECSFQTQLQNGSPATILPGFSLTQYC